jgi:hypothetical protein
MITRIAVVGSCSGQGKTTLARALAQKIDGTFVELDAVRHGSGWTITPPEEVRAAIAPVIATERWTIDAVAETMLGRLVLDRVQLVVWLDLPPWIWMPRLLRRSARRWLLREEVCNGNRETLHGIFVARDGLFPYAIRRYFGHRRALGEGLQRHVLAGQRLVRLCDPAEVDSFLRAFPASPARA